jgi:myo-inositol-1(or 4)-monophosphatase
MSIPIEEMVDIARAAGVVMNNHFRSHGMSRVVKADLTPVTVADNAINEMVIRRIVATGINIDVIGEEASRRQSSRWQIACDPIDGTFPYTWGTPVSTFMLALLYDGIVQKSVIFDPFTDRMYTAERGSGAFLNGVPIAVSTNTVSDNPVIGYVSWKGCGTNMHAICGHLESLGFQCVNFCSIGYLEAMVATGELVGTIFPQRKRGAFHDTAPGHLLVEEAGGVVCDLNGAPQDYLREDFRGHVMANSPCVRDVLLSTIAKYG